MPTFLFFKNNQKIETLQGADPKRLEQTIANLGGSLFDMVRFIAFLLSNQYFTEMV